MATYDYAHNGQEVVQEHADFKHLTATTSATVMLGAGRIVGLFCANLGDGAKVSLYDATASGGTAIIGGLAVATGTAYNLFNVRVKTGIFASMVSATGADVTIFYLKDEVP